MKTKTDKAPRIKERRRYELAAKIMDRAFAEIRWLKNNVDRRSLAMDLHSVPELDLPKLLAAPEFDFAHDICGIIRHMDRSSCPGKLMNCFWPRCARQ